MGPDEIKVRALTRELPSPQPRPFPEDPIVQAACGCAHICTHMPTYVCILADKGFGALGHTHVPRHRKWKQNLTQGALLQTG